MDPAFIEASWLNHPSEEISDDVKDHHEGRIPTRPLRKDGIALSDPLLDTHPSLARMLAQALEQIGVIGDFCASGHQRVKSMCVEVDGVGTVALPLTESQARFLVAAAEPAPYGRGEEAVIDTSVRRTWQIDASRLKTYGNAWAKALNAIVYAGARGLGVVQPVTAELTKMLIYEEGGFFTPHRDTEKAPGMFATLVVTLPLAFQGGELLVRHKGEERMVRTICSDPFELGWATFYADCEHEVRPVTQGMRVALVYSLIRSGVPSVAPESRADVGLLTHLLASWKDTDPDKILYLLEHRYTTAQLRFDTLKGSDVGRAAALRSAGRAADCDVSLSFVAFKELRVGNEVMDGAWHRRDLGLRGDEIVDVPLQRNSPRVRRGKGERFSPADDGGRLASRWASITGCREGDTVYDNCPVKAQEVATVEAQADELYGVLEDCGSWDHMNHSHSRGWQRAAVVVSPKGRRFEVLVQRGISVFVPFLESLMVQWMNERNEASRDDARSIVQCVMRTWSVSTRGWLRRDAFLWIDRFLAVLRCLGDVEAIEAVQSLILRNGEYI